MPIRSFAPKPWHEFLSDAASALTEGVYLHCLGGFVVSQCYGLDRPTADVDFVSMIRRDDQQTRLLNLAGAGSSLHKKYGVYLNAVTVANLPLEYEDRLVEMFPRIYGNLHLCALDPYDLALSKLSRNSERDRSDVKYLVKTVPLDGHILKERYEREFRPYYVGRTSEADGTMRLWLEAFYEQ
jgi:hypothetical protein